MADSCHISGRGHLNSRSCTKNWDIMQWIHKYSNENSIQDLTNEM